jgi:hypothetical protein
MARSPEFLPADDVTVVAETDPSWRTARNCDSGACVEVGQSALTREVLVRDSTRPDGNRLHANPETWREFLGEIKRGRYDSPQAPF